MRKRPLHMPKEYDGIDLERNQLKQIAQIDKIIDKKGRSALIECVLNNNIQGSEYRETNEDSRRISSLKQGREIL